jgi:hypothetical protein
MPNAAEELLGSCDAALLGTLAWNRTFDKYMMTGRAPQRAERQGGTERAASSSVEQAEQRRAIGPTTPT